MFCVLGTYFILISFLSLPIFQEFLISSGPFILLLDLHTGCEFKKLNTLSFLEILCEMGKL